MSERNEMAVRANRPWAMRLETLRTLAAGQAATFVPEGWPAVTASGNGDRQPGTPVVEVSGPLYAYMARPLAAALNAAATTTQRDVVVAVNSPGGDVAGMADVVGAMRAARAVVEAKGGRLVALINDEACSAGYWLASQASEVWATRLAEVGCLGVYAVLYDETAAFAQMGVQPVVVANDGAGLKGAGVPGTPVSEELVAQVRKACNAATAAFAADVATGRGKPVEAINGLMTGAVWTAKEAEAMGLVDRVTAGGLAEVVAELNTNGAGQAMGRAGRAASTHTARRRSLKMADADTKAVTLEELQGMPGGPELIKMIEEAALAAAKAAAEKAADGDSGGGKAASVAELKAAFPGQADFVIGCLERGDSLLAAKARMGEVATVKLEAMAKQVAELEKRLAAGSNGGGTQPVKNAGGAGNANANAKPDGTVFERYEAAVAKAMAEHKCARLQAAAKVAQADPALSREYHAEKKRKG